MSSGGSSSTTSTQIPDWALNYVQGNLALGDQISQQPYQPYTAPRIAPQNQFQTRAIENLVNHQLTGGAGDMLNNAATGVNSVMNAAAPMIQGPSNVQASGYNPTMAQAASVGQMQGYSPITGTAQQAALAAAMTPAQMQAASMQAASMQAAMMDPSAANPINVRQANRGDISNVSADQIKAMLFPDADISRYINPYVQQALDPTLREIGRQGEQMRNQNAARASAAGAFGGSRHGVVDAEQQRNTMQLLGDTQARGMDAAFGRASDLIMQDANRTLTADQSNQDASLRAGLANQGADLSVTMGNLQAGMQGDMFNANLGMERARLNQAAENAARMQNAGFQQQAGMTNAGFQQEAGRVNAGFTQDAGLANMNAANQLNQFNVGQSNEFGLANLGYQNEAARFGADWANRTTSQNAINQNMVNMANAGYGNDASRFNAGQIQNANTANALMSFNVGAQNQDAILRQMGLGIQGAGALTGMAQADQAMAMQDFQSLFGVGQWQQTAEQANADLAYQDFLRQQNYPFQQLQTRIAAMGGAPFPQTQTTSASGNGNDTATILASLAAGAGLAGRYGLFG